MIRVSTTLFNFSISPSTAQSVKGEVLLCKYNEEILRKYVYEDGVFVEKAHEQLADGFQSYCFKEITEASVYVLNLENLMTFMLDLETLESITEVAPDGVLIGFIPPEDTVFAEAEGDEYILRMKPSDITFRQKDGLWKEFFLGVTQTLRHVVVIYDDGLAKRLDAFDRQGEFERERERE